MQDDACHRTPLELVLRHNLAVPLFNCRRRPYKMCNDSHNKSYFVMLENRVQRAFKSVVYFGSSIFIYTCTCLNFLSITVYNYNKNLYQYFVHLFCCINHLICNVYVMFINNVLHNLYIIITGTQLKQISNNISALNIICNQIVKGNYISNVLRMLIMSLL